VDSLGRQVGLRDHLLLTSPFLAPLQPLLDSISPVQNPQLIVDVVLTAFKSITHVYVDYCHSSPLDPYSVQRIADTMALAISQVKNDLHTCSNHSLHDQETLKFNEAILVYQGHIATENPQIPVPALFEFGPTPRSQLRGPRIPSMAECAVHLELLQVFCSLRNRVLESTGLDELLEIKANTRTVYRSTTISYYKTTREAVQIRDETFDERRKVKWPFYLSLAASRFLHWVDAVEDGADFAQIMPPIGELHS